MVVVGAQWAKECAAGQRPALAPAQPPCSDGSERTHERWLDLGPLRRHLAPRRAIQKGQALGMHWDPKQGPQNNQKPLTSLASHRP